MNQVQALFTILVLAAALCGCSVLRVETPHATVTTYLPAWPWQDSTKTLERLAVSSATNKVTISIRGLSDSEATSTNSAEFLGAVVGSAFRAYTGR